MVVSLSVIKRCSAFLRPHSTKQVLQVLVLSYLDYCPVIWSSAAKDLVKLQLAQNRVAGFALHCSQKANINTMHDSLSWLRVEERLTALRLVFIRNMNVLEIPNCLHSQLTYSTHTLTPPDMPPGVFSQHNASPLYDLLVMCMY
jgi:hypothetical protein